MSSKSKYFDEDSLLAEKAREGDNAAFEELVRKYQSQIYGFALHVFRNPDLAEDTAQETFLRAYRFLHTYDVSRRFVTWLYSIARNLCIDRHRERARRETVNIEDIPQRYLAGDETVSPDPSRQLEANERHNQLLAAISQLPEKYRTPMVLCYLQELPYQQISEVLGITLNNTKIRIFRAKKMLIEMLGDEE